MICACPVIAMDGAVLYDVKDKRYRATSGLPKEWVDRICTLVKEKEYHYFLNVVWQNVLLIYFGEFKNEVERELYLSNPPICLTAIIFMAKCRRMVLWYISCWYCRMRMRMHWRQN